MLNYKKQTKNMDMAEQVIFGTIQDAPATDKVTVQYIMDETSIPAGVVEGVLESLLIRKLIIKLGNEYELRV